MPTRILVVDDNPNEISLVLNWLRQEGYEVALAERGEQALLMAEQATPDLMLLDAQMSGINGVEICQRLRRNASTAEIPVILMSVRSANEARAESIQAGANDFIVRPFKSTDLQQHINSLLNTDNVAASDTYRLLEELCQAALAVLPCNLAWLLIIEDGVLRSRMIATDRGRGSSAGEVFLRLVSDNAAGHPNFPLTPGNNPLTDTILKVNPAINITAQQIGESKGGTALSRALGQLRLSYAHFLPLSAMGQTVGLLLLASKGQHDLSKPQGQKLIMALVNQASTVVENTRLVSHLAARQEQMRVEQAFRKMVLDTMGDGLAVIDEEAIIRYVNTRLLRMSGYTRTELYGNSIGVIFHPEGRERLTTNLKRQARATVNLSQQLVTKSGKVVPVLMSRATGAVGGTGDQSTVLVFSDLSEQKRREIELERQGERLRALNRAVQAITSALTVDDVITVLLQSAGEVVQCASTCLFLKDTEHEDMYTVVAAMGPQGDALRGLTIREGEGIAGMVAHDHQSRMVASVEADGLSKQIERSGSAVLAVPLVIMDQIIGVLEAINKIDGQFVGDDLEILENLASSASVAVENARLFTQTQRRVNELSTLLDASAAVSSTLDINAVLELVARRLSEALSVARCLIGSWDSKVGKLAILAEVCNSYWDAGKGPVRPAIVTPLLMVLLQEGQPTIYRRAAPEIDLRMQNYMTQLGMHHALLFPLRYGQSIVGMLELFSPQETAEFNARNVQAIEDAVTRWREQVRKRNVSSWQDRDSLTDLYQRVMRASGAQWCIISSWERSERAVRSVREIGFALWEPEVSRTYVLDGYTAMAYSLTQGAPVTLYPDTRDGDANERALMAQLGTSSGLIVPLLVRGEAVGLVKLLDTDGTRTFDIADISLCQGIANVLANAMENAQLYKSLERRANALQAAYDELRLSDKVKDALIQNLSHELQTPLHQVVMQLDLIVTEAFGPVTPDQVQNLQSAITKTTQLGDLIRDMLSLRTLDIQDMQFAETSLGDIVSKAVGKQQPKADKVQIKIICEMPPNLPTAWANAERLSDVLDQLLDNAIKFSPKAERKSDRVDVRVEIGEGPMLSVSVQDYGIGIQAAEFDKIFHRGYQVDGSLTRRFGGTGLGLALARQIVEAHGGKIWVESTANAGSRFYFTIPKFGVQFGNKR